jgi:hypothetical protein
MTTFEFSAAERADALLQLGKRVKIIVQAAPY